MFLGFMDKYRDEGLLILRIGIGLMFIIVHGLPKITGGPQQWGQLGMAMQNVGIDFAPVFWGFMSALAEFGGGICLLLGIFVRPACVFMFINMCVATCFHFKGGDGIAVASHAIEMGVVFFSLIFIGGGKYALDALFFRKK